MAQRLDDVTGKPVAPLSAQQRDAQRQAIIAQMNAMILQMNAITDAVRSLRLEHDTLFVRVDGDADKAIRNGLRHDAFVGRGLAARLRWLVTGR